MVFKLADALSRPFHRHFSPPRNAKPSHSTRQPNTLELPQLNHDPLNPFLLPRPQRKYLETTPLDNVKISTPEYPVPEPFRHFPRNMPQEMQAQPSSRQPHQNSTINGTISPPRTFFATSTEVLRHPPCSRCLVNNTGLSPSPGPDATADHLHVM